jgi:hypothetical protein
MTIEDDRLSLQADLGAALRARYLETSDPDDLNEAIELTRAVASAPRRAAEQASRARRRLDLLGRIPTLTSLRRTGLRPRPGHRRPGARHPG